MRSLGGRLEADGTGTREAVARHPGTAKLVVVMVTIVVLFGFGPPVAKLVTAPAMVSASVRFWIAMPFLWVIAYAIKRPVSLFILRRTALPGVFFGLNVVLNFAALKHSSVAVLSIILTLQPGVVLLVAGPWLGERATLWHGAWTMVAVASVVGSVLAGDPKVRGSLLGLALGVGSMVSFTAFYLLSRREHSKSSIHPIQWMAGIALVALIVVTPVTLLGSSWSDYHKMGGTDLLFMAYVTMAGTVGHVMLTWAHRYIPATRSSLILLLMNVVATAAAWPIHHEPVTLAQAAGGFVVLAAVGAVVSRPGASIAEELPDPMNL